MRDPRALLAAQIALEHTRRKNPAVFGLLRGGALAGGGKVGKENS